MLTVTYSVMADSLRKDRI